MHYALRIIFSEVSTMIDLATAGYLFGGLGGAVGYLFAAVGMSIEQFNQKFSARIERECPQHADYLKKNLQSAISAISLVGETALMTAY